MPTLPPMPTLSLILTLPLIPPSSQQALIIATLLPVSAVNWEQIKKFRSILQVKYIKIYSYYKKQ